MMVEIQSKDSEGYKIFLAKRSIRQYYRYNEVQAPDRAECDGETDAVGRGDERTVRRRTERQNCLSVLHSADVAGAVA